MEINTPILTDDFQIVFIDAIEMIQIHSDPDSIKAHLIAFSCEGEPPQKIATCDTEEKAQALLECLYMAMVTPGVNLNMPELKRNLELMMKQEDSLKKKHEPVDPRSFRRPQQ